MCGIIAAIAERNVVPILMEGLKKLEYRGYDSAGIAVINDNKFVLNKTKGKVKFLQEIVQKNYTHGRIGIGHTRWATHGKPSEINAHPHVINNTIAIVHNGIIENYEELQTQIQAQQKFKFKSETDTEVIAAKIYFYKLQGLDLLTAVINTCKELRGAYSICVMDIDNPKQIIAAKFGSPLIVGVGVGEYFLSSDSLALQNLTQDLIYLKDGDVVSVSSEREILVYDFAGKKIKRSKSQLTILQDTVDKGQYRHFMQKEIFEQPKAVAATLEGRIVKDHITESFLGINAKKILDSCKHIQIVACGTSFYAGLVAKYLFEEFANIHCDVDIASEFRYSKKVVLDNSLLITISQSGETADTIAALKNTLELPNQDLEKYCGFLTICNVPESALVRLSELTLLTNAGPEIGVASTKAFTTQLTAILILLAIFVNKNPNKNLNSKQIVNDLKKLPEILENFLKLSNQISLIAKNFEHKKSALFLGRGMLFPLALEGALKLKELSYIHAEAYPSGELKHGPLALVDDEMPVVVLMSNNDLVDKLKSNIQEVQARGGNVIVFADQAIKWKSKKNLQLVEMPSVPYWLAPIAYAIPMQLLAYHSAVLKGTDVDQPRNLAKSVTVE